MLLFLIVLTFVVDVLEFLSAYFGVLSAYFGSFSAYFTLYKCITILSLVIGLDWTNRDINFRVTFDHF